MSEAVERLTRLVQAEDRYDIPFAALRDAQIQAMNERLQERKGQIKLVGHRAQEAGIAAVRSHEEAVRLLLPHTAYKSYPEGWLAQKRWDRLSKWLDTVSTYRVPVSQVSSVDEVDGWIGKLGENGFFVSCSSGTTGKSAMLVASQKDMDWCRTEAPVASGHQVVLRGLAPRVQAEVLFGTGQGEWSAAAGALTVTLPPVPAACLIRRYLRDRRGDPAGAREAWRQGLPKVHPKYAWGSSLSTIALVQGMILATLVASLGLAIFAKGGLMMAMNRTFTQGRPIGFEFLRIEMQDGAGRSIFGAIDQVVAG